MNVFIYLFSVCFSLSFQLTFGSINQLHYLHENELILSKVYSTQHHQMFNFFNHSKACGSRFLMSSICPSYDHTGQLLSKCSIVCLGSPQLQVGPFTIFHLNNTSLQHPVRYRFRLHKILVNFSECRITGMADPFYLLHFLLDLWFSGRNRMSEKVEFYATLF